MTREASISTASPLVSLDPRWVGLGAAYFLYFGLLGCLQPYLATLYLEHGLEKGSVGPSVAVLYILAGVMPLFATSAAARYRLSAKTALGLCAAAALLVALLLAANGSQFSHLTYVLLIATLTSAYAPINALLDTSALKVCEQRGWSFGRLRLMGSLGYIATATGLGRLLPLSGVSQEVHWAITVVLAALVALSPFLPATSPGASPEAVEQASSERLVPTRATLLCLIAACGLHYASFGPFQYGFTLYGKSVGLTPGAIGLGWSLGVASEVATFSIATALLARFGWRSLLWTAFCLAPVRWLSLAAFPLPATFFVSQLLHGPSFALFYAATMAALSEVRPDARAQRSQTIYCALVAGLASGPAMFVAGYAYAHISLGSMFACMLPANIITMLLFALSQRYASRSREDEKR